jgi:hypothetical protein
VAFDLQKKLFKCGQLLSQGGNRVATAHKRFTMRGAAGFEAAYFSAFADKLALRAFPLVKKPLTLGGIPPFPSGRRKILAGKPSKDSFGLFSIYNGTSGNLLPLKTAAAIRCFCFPKKAISQAHFTTGHWILILATTP